MPKRVRIEYPIFITPQLAETRAESHVCSACRTPYGKSSIPCPREGAEKRKRQTIRNAELEIIRRRLNRKAITRWRSLRVSLPDEIAEQYEQEFDREHEIKEIK